MNWLQLSRLLGLLAMLVGGSMVFSLPWAFPLLGEAVEFESKGFWALIETIIGSLCFGGLLVYLGRRESSTAILRKEAMAVVGLGWILAGIIGSLPLFLAGVMRAPDTPVTAIDALFESISGFTTTGASVLTELDDPAAIPRCVLFWRCFTHWLGGMGIIVLFVAVLGQLGAGGKAMMKREVPGPINESVRPRVRDTAVTMWLIYVAISGVLVGIYALEGMTFYDALCHSFATMATGGFSTHNASLGHFQSPVIELTATFFMIVAGSNFTLYYLVWKGRRELGEGRIASRLKPWFSDPEYRTYLAIIACATGAFFINLELTDRYLSWTESLRHSLFTTVTIITTTGFGTVDFTEWSEFSKGLILLLMFVGGCSGSTSGGLKVVRFLLFFKIIRLEIERAYRPNVVRPMKVFGVTVDKEMRHDVVVYFSLILFVFVSAWMVLNVIESDRQWENGEDVKAEKLIDCASAVASCLNNIGPGLGVLGPHNNYSGFSPQGKLLLTLLMLLGRLELFAILVLFVPDFWRV
ncbi:TrkH family potassium uptake protein [Stratiformator vulcanicus]|uniref:Trk system potassium uptake protein TrkG n=1 Tax=Stratiformator vulcanicus TaxID=2527980 RepID=A0A517R5E8_9PLAN|nr:TrkH family potassium uptake protein [Stratiformator vulcanicus]QDT39111.1 Trk system potassium uptake protein TrkG [Stratiformator vulcanicus]